MNNREIIKLLERCWPEPVEVFKTDVQDGSQADRLVALLRQHFPGSKINFDLDDCDKILRLAGADIAPASVISVMQDKGFRCWELA